MKNGYYKYSYAIVVSTTLIFLISTPLFANQGCQKLVWEGIYSVQNHEDLILISGYTEIGWLNIVNSDLTNLEGLECLTRVEYLSISGNDFLTSLKGLKSLTNVGELVIYDNDSLKNLEGLENLNSVRGFFICDNDSLTSIKELISLEIVEDWFETTYNDELCTSSANALLDQVINAMIPYKPSVIEILDNKDC